MPVQRQHTKGTILLVEDNKMDVTLARQCFSEIAPAIELFDVENGLEALAFLRGEGEYSEAPKPELILLDLNMPKMDGRELLAELAKDDTLNCLPVVVLTNSQFDDDIRQSYLLGATSYIRKPIDYEHFEKIVKRIVDYWFGLVVLPREY